MEQAERHIVGREHVEDALLGEIAGGDVAGMRFAAHDVRRAHQHAHASLMRCPRGLDARREFGQAHAVVDRLVDMGERRIVMAGEGDAPLAADAWRWRCGAASN